MVAFTLRICKASHILPLGWRRRKSHRWICMYVHGHLCVLVHVCPPHPPPLSCTHFSLFFGVSFLVLIYIPFLRPRFIPPLGSMRYPYYYNKSPFCLNQLKLIFTTCDQKLLANTLCHNSFLFSDISTFVRFKNHPCKIFVLI